MGIVISKYGSQFVYTVKGKLVLIAVRKRKYKLSRKQFAYIMSARTKLSA